MTREEAIEIVKKHGILADGTKFESALRELIPELRESEDERITDTIFNCLYQCCDTGFISGTQRDNALAYLEKQKEQKPADLSEMMVHKEPYIAPVPTPMVADEQKPAEPSGKLSRQDYLYQLLIDQLITYSDYEYLTEQKSAESKEDTQLLAGDYAISHYEQGKTYSSMEVHKMLADAFIAGKSYQKPEWSEEDEKMLNDLIGVFSQNQIIHPDGYLKIDKCGNNERKVIEFVAFLKSLRSRPKASDNWKPSEEQLNLLLNIEGKLRADGKLVKATQLAELYEQIKKLM